MACRTCTVPLPRNLPLGVTVSQPKCDRLPEVHKPKDVVDLARRENTEGARLNAESWTQAAMAMYLQQTFGLSTPPVPIEYAPLGVQNDPAIAAIDTDDLVELFLNEMPEGFVPPVAQGSPEFNPDMTNVVRLSSVPYTPSNVLDTPGADSADGVPYPPVA